MRWVKKLYGHGLAQEFDSVSLETVRQEMIKAGLCRNRINRDVPRIKRMFKWGAAQQLIPIETYHSLTVVEGLRAGRSAAKETEPVTSVDWSVVEQVLSYLPPPVAAMVELQYHTGMRPGEVVLLRAREAAWRSRLSVEASGEEMDEFERFLAEGAAMAKGKTPHQVDVDSDEERS